MHRVVVPARQPMKLGISILDSVPGIDSPLMGAGSQVGIRLSYRPAMQPM
jgi:hypothetical protein